MTFINWKRGMGVVASVSMIALVLAGCGTNRSGSSTTPTSKEGGSIILDANGSVKDLDPALAYDTESAEIVSQLYSQLVTYKGTGSTIAPMAASSWEISPDGKTYTFHIRPGMKFTNGDPVTAESFVDEFDRVLNPKINSPGEGFLDPIVVGSTAYNQGKATSVSGIKAVDTNTLQIQLTKPEPFFLEVLAQQFFSAVDQKYINSVGATAFDSKDAMGSGPFELASVSPNQYVLKKNPHYWMKDAGGNQLPYLNQVTIRINENSELDALNFEKGQTALLASTMDGIPSTAWPQFISTPSLKSTIVQAPENATFYLGMNNSMKPFNNVLVRRAVEFAINKQKIVKLLDSRVEVADQPLPPGIEGFVKNLPANASYTYNPAMAKKLLTQAGFPSGFTTSFYTFNDTDSMKIAESIQNDLSQVGIKVNIIPEASGTFMSNNEKGNVTALFQYAWYQDFPDASDFLNTLFNTNEQPQNNSTMYSNKQVDTWLNKAQTDTNQTERNQLYAQVTDQVMSDADWVPMYYGVTQYAVQPWVHGFYINPTLPDQLQLIWLDPSHRNDGTSS